MGPHVLGKGSYLSDDLLELLSGQLPSLPLHTCPHARRSRLSPDDTPRVWGYSWSPKVPQAQPGKQSSTSPVQEPAGFLILEATKVGVMPLALVAVQPDMGTLFQ